MREFSDGSTAIVRGRPERGLHLLRWVSDHPRVADPDEDDAGAAQAWGAGDPKRRTRIASIGMCIGATMAGARAFTATSGPGISLYSENIGLADHG